MSSKEYGILALQNEVIFPGNIVPLEIVSGVSPEYELIDEAMEEEKPIVILTKKPKASASPGINDLYKVGCKADIVQCAKKDGKITIFIEGFERVKLMTFDGNDPYETGTFETLDLEIKGSQEERELYETLKTEAKAIASSMPEIPKETPNRIDSFQDPVDLAYFLASSFNISMESRQDLLEINSLEVLLEALIDLTQGQVEISETNDRIEDNVDEMRRDTEREYYLRQRLKAIKKELGEEEDDVGELERRLNETPMPEEAEEAARKQFNRLQVMQPSSSEYSVVLNYVETLLDVPWFDYTDDNLDLDQAQATLDADHYGLDKVKDRIVEYLAVRSLKNDMKGPILCLVGPPGVGKTSLGQSIARSLGRKFRRISLGGVHDESEIRGHRRTYVGALPGRIVKALNKTGTANPLLMLDEIDKMSKDFKGDPQAAMLEVLDPEQNHQFSDHYLEVPLDLSKVLFIATANSLDTISEPLKDRMEIIEVPSYTSYEKRQIAREFLIPKQIEEHGISESNVNIEDEALRLLVDRYTKEAGVRALERRVADVCRSVAVEIAKTPSDERDGVSIDVDKEYVVEHLGPERFRSQVAQRTSTPGVATGLAWTRVGGDILFVETTTMSGEGKVKLTGQLGDVMKESAEAAFSYIKSRASDFGLDEEKIKQRDLHLHVPAGAIPKDGPSAGITIFSSILSIFTDTTVKKDLAMTGEITLRGNILPVGGIKEKLTAAHRAGIKEVVIPKLCEKDLVELNDEVKNELTIHLVERVEELPELVFDEDLPNVPVSALSEDDDLAETPA